MTGSIRQTSTTWKTWHSKQPPKWDAFPTQSAIRPNCCTQQQVNVMTRLPVDTKTLTFAIFWWIGGSDDWAKSIGIKYSYTVELPDTGVNGFVLPASYIPPVCEDFFPAFKVFTEQVANMAGWFNLQLHLLIYQLLGWISINYHNPFSKVAKCPPFLHFTRLQKVRFEE